MKNILKKHSLSTELLGIFLLGVLALTVTMSVIFTMRMRNIATRQVESTIREQIVSLRDNLVLTFQVYEDALEHASAGISLLYERTGEPFLGPEAISEQEMRRFLLRIKENLPNASQVFMANNIPTFEPGGFAVFAPEWRFGDDYDQRTRPWFIDAKANPGVVAFTDPYWAMATGIFTVSLSTIIYDGNRNDLGVIVVDIAIESLTDIVAAASDAEGINSWLLNGDGLFISHENYDAVMRDNFFDNPHFAAFRHQALNNDTFYTMGDTYVLSSARIPGAGWIVVSTIPTAVVFADVNQAIFTTVIVTAGIIVLFFIILAFAIRRISKPILAIVQSLKDIAEGEGDLTRQINIRSNNEIGDLARYFNQTIDKIRNLIVNVKNQADSLSQVGHELSVDMTETAASMHQIAANIHNIKGRMLNQSASVTQTNTTMEQITANIKKLDDLVEKQYSAVSQGSLAIEEMVARIDSITSTLKKNAENVIDLKGAAELGRSSLAAVTVDIQEIARESEGLMEINAVMQNIASQTNLLSMNAAIEAAHAGDSGRGFAVVADEIRKLAESSSKQSKTINTALKKMKGSIDKIAQSTGDVFKKFETIDNGIKIVAEQDEKILGAMEDKRRGSKQVLSAVEQVNEITALVKTSSHEMLDGATEVIKEADNLEKSTEEITNGMNEIDNGTDQVDKAITNVNRLTQNNENEIELLIKEVSKFKVA